MYVKKHGNNIFGANLTAAEKKALDMEIKRELAEFNEQNMTEIDAIVLWVLHEDLGFGKKRLKRFFFNFHKHTNELQKRYMMAEDGDLSWLCKTRLEGLGIDIDAWEKECEEYEKRGD